MAGAVELTTGDDAKRRAQRVHRHRVEHHPPARGRAGWRRAARGARPEDVRPARVRRRRRDRPGDRHGAGLGRRGARRRRARMRGRAHPRGRDGRHPRRPQPRRAVRRDPPRGGAARARPRRRCGGAPRVRRRGRDAAGAARRDRRRRRRGRGLVGACRRHGERRRELVRLGARRLGRAHGAPRGERPADARRACPAARPRRRRVRRRPRATRRVGLRGGRQRDLAAPAVRRRADPAHARGRPLRRRRPSGARRRERAVAGARARPSAPGGARPAAGRGRGVRWCAARHRPRRPAGGRPPRGFRGRSGDVVEYRRWPRPATSTDCARACRSPRPPRRPSPCGRRSCSSTRRASSTRPTPSACTTCASRAGGCGPSSRSTRRASRRRSSRRCCARSRTSPTRSASAATRTCSSTVSRPSRRCSRRRTRRASRRSRRRYARSRSAATRRSPRRSSTPSARISRGAWRCSPRARSSSRRTTCPRRRPSRPSPPRRRRARTGHPRHEGPQGQGPRSGGHTGRQRRADRAGAARRAPVVHPARARPRQGHRAARHADRRQAAALRPRGDGRALLRAVLGDGAEAHEGAAGPARRDPRLRRAAAADHGPHGGAARRRRADRPDAGARQSGRPRSEVRDPNVERARVARPRDDGDLPQGAARAAVRALPRALDAPGARRLPRAPDVRSERAGGWGRGRNTTFTGRQRHSRRGGHSIARAIAMTEQQTIRAVPTPVPQPEPPSDLDDRKLYDNRELSWLSFNERVLELSERPDEPLLERLKFSAIFTSNLDEFFMIRVAGLHDQVDAGLSDPGPDGRTPSQVIDELRVRIVDLSERQTTCFYGELTGQLADHGIRIVSIDDLSREQGEELAERFRRQIFPVLTPLAVGVGRPFPYISNLSLSLAVLVRDPQTGVRTFARVKVPKEMLPRFLEVTGNGHTFVALEEVIAAHLQALFPGMEVVDSGVFRVTRDADFEVSDEADDLLEAVEAELRRRRFGEVVRLEINADMSDELREALTQGLRVEQRQVYTVKGLLDFNDLWQIVKLPGYSELRDPSWTPVTQPRLHGEDGEGVDMFEVIRQGDVLVHHPYDSFSTSVERFVAQAVEDPDVLAIKMTVYRTSDDTPLVPALIRATERGKQAVCMVELKARGDERANIGWARALEEAGVHVVYGHPALKTHAKCLLVVRREGDGVRHYVHIGTGNYHPQTARLYTDFGLFTCEEELGADVGDMFNFLTGFARPRRFRKVLVAPTFLRDAIITEIEDTVAAHKDGEQARIAMKMNALVDRRVIRALYRASQAGVQVDLNIRSICCLVPGIEGVSENIRVVSVVGRFLEHSRIFAFERDGSTKVYIGSADLMPRNLDTRVELVAPVEDAVLKEDLLDTLERSLADDTNAWELRPDSTWERRVPDEREPRSVQRELMMGHAARAAEAQTQSA